MRLVLRGRLYLWAAPAALPPSLAPQPTLTPRPRPPHPHPLLWQLVKLRVAEGLNPLDTAALTRASSAASGSASLVYAVRLKGSAKVAGLLKRDGLQGLDVRAGARRLVAAAQTAATQPAPSAAPPTLQ